MPNPEAIPPLHAKHIRVLERYRNHLIGKIAAGGGEYPGSGFDCARKVALDVAIAELTELLEKRGSDA